MDRSEGVGGPMEVQGIFLRFDHLGQLFGDSNTSTTHRFPKRSLLSRSYDKSRNVPSTHALKIEVPVWKDSNTFTGEQRQQGVARGQEVNRLAAKLAAKYNAPTRKQSDIFYPHIHSEMCYTEDVYHVPCGHWADRPRIYHRCVAAPDQPLDQLHTVPSLPRLEAQIGRYREHGDPKLPKPGMRMSTPCTNAVTRGPATDEYNKCGRCRIDVERIVSNQTENNDTSTDAKAVKHSSSNIVLCTAVEEPSRVLSVSDWQNPPTRYNPFDDDASTLVNSSKSSCPSGNVQSHYEEKQCNHELLSEQEAKLAAEHINAARRFLNICIDKLKTVGLKQNTFITEGIEGVGTWYDPDSIGPLEKAPALG